MTTKIVYARLFNKGNYENERIELEADVDADVMGVFMELRHEVLRLHEAGEILDQNRGAKL